MLFLYFGPHSTPDCSHHNRSHHTTHKFAYMCKPSTYYARTYFYELYERAYHKCTYCCEPYHRAYPPAYYRRAY